MKKSITCSVVLAIAALLVGLPAEACSCRESRERSGVEELPEYDAVFLGRVMSMRLIREPMSAPERMEEVMEIAVEVDRSWKGVRNPNVAVKTSASGASCGYPFKLGKTYLVYARGTSEPYLAHLCDPTKLAAKAEIEIAELAEPIWERPE